MKKPFLITIDTEGDNLWTLDLEKDIIQTKNLFYLRRFQQLCEKYNFIPTYLVNFETLTDLDFVNYFKEKLISNKCEIGIHLHAWNNPPLYDLKKRSDGLLVDKPYLIEYPYSFMQQKFKLLYDLIVQKFGIKPIVHRSGRWALDNNYIKILNENGIVFDCSFTPGIDWRVCPGYTDGSRGTDYTNVPRKICKFKNTNVFEMPVSTTIIRSHRTFCFRNLLKFKCPFPNISNKKVILMRPNGFNINDLFQLAKKYVKKDYLMFMLHSSEMMPGGSPTFADNESIENLFTELNIFFSYISNHFYGSSFKDFYLKRLNQYKHCRQFSFNN